MCIRDSVESGLLSVEDLLIALLDISRLDTAAPTPKHEDFVVADLFFALNAQFSQTFEEQGLTLRFADSKLCAHSDPALLRRILQNFVSNARRYTRAGGVLVGCRRRGENIAIQVIDTGVGIADSDQKAVFDEFHRLSDGAESAKRGLGLGLAIVDRIARLLGHPISLRSVLGKGSCFEVLVPRAKDNNVSTKRLAPTEQRASSQLGSQVVMCVDNEQEILDGMHGLLSKWGAQPLIATTMADALTQLDSASSMPSLLLIDYHLNDGVTGLDVIDALRRKAGVNLPAAILTANYTTEVADLVREAGHALLHKPVKPAALRALINRLLTRRVTH